MSHSSQVTKSEYTNRHETNITSKMANVWERKIGSDKEHKPSPTTVLKQSTEKMETINRLPRAGSKKASSDLRRKNTKEIVETFEKMAGNNEARNLGLSEVEKLEKRRSMNNGAYEKGRKSEILDIEQKGISETKEDLRKLIERISKQMDDISGDLAVLNSKIDSL